MPTLHNLGRACSPPQPTDPFFLRKPITQAGQSGDYYAQAYALEPRIQHAVDASREYLRAYQIGMQASSADLPPDGLPALRNRAIEWLQKGTAQDDGISWANYGVLLMDEKDYAQARAAFEKGAAQNIAVAHYHLARMAEAGLGLPQRDRAQALDHYEHAARLGMDTAREPACALLTQHLESVRNLDELEQGVKRLDAIDDKAGCSKTIGDRLAWGRLLETRQKNQKPLPNRPIFLRACDLDLNQTFGREYNLSSNTWWRLTAYTSLDESQRLEIEGLVDAKGCAAWREPLSSDIRKLLDQGALLALRFPNYTLPLRWVETPKGIELNMQPQGTPIRYR